MIPAIFGLSGLQLTQDERAFFRDCDPAGYILFGRNVADRAQLLALTEELRAIHGREHLLISIDQEGGRVARMKPPQWEAFPPGADFAALYQIAPASAIEAARANAQALAMDLAEVGITVDYTPLLDVRQEGAHDVIGDRALGSEPMQVAALGRAILDGLARGGVTGCVKHMPGHGRAMVDSHKDLPIVEADEAALEVDIAAFARLADAPIAMSAHIRFTAWDANNPATLSPFVIEEIIRKKIGFGGLLLTDDIDMEALSGSVPERAKASLGAGCDIVLNCWAKMDDMRGIAERVGVMGEAVTTRLESALTYPERARQQGDRAELIARRDTLLDLARAQV